MPFFLPSALQAFFALVSLLAVSLHAQQAGSLDAAFNPGFGVDGSVYALTVNPNDGRTLVAGQFAAVNGVARPSLARLHPDGSLDAGFTPPVLSGSGGAARALALQPDGRLLVGGTFSKVGAQARAGLARLLPDGSLDPSFAPDLRRLYSTASVYAVLLQPDGRILVAGTFDMVGTITRRGVTRLNADGSLDPTFDPAQPQNVFPAQGLDGDAEALGLAPDGKLVVMGSFSQVNGFARRGLARLHPDGSLDETFAPALGSSPVYRAIAVEPATGAVLAAGYLYPSPAPKGSSNPDVLRLLPGSGQVDLAFSKARGNTAYLPYSDVRAIALAPDGKIVLGGGVLSLRNQTRPAVARLHPDGSPDGSFFASLDAQTSGSAPAVAALAVAPDGGVVVGGAFDTIEGSFRHRLARLTGSPAENTPQASVVTTASPAVMATGAGAEFTVTLQGSVAAPMKVAYSVAGADSYLYRTLPGKVKFKPGKGVAKVAVVPNSPYASVPNGAAKLQLFLEGGRGYVVGGPAKAKAQILNRTP